MSHIWVLLGQEDAYYTNYDDAESEHGRLKLAFVSIDDPVIEDGEYYVRIPENCPYSGLPCRGGGCTPCEYVP